jgi:hypothetical protein
VKRGGSLSFLVGTISNVLGYHTTYGKNPIFRLIKSNNSGTAKVKIVKKERDPPLFTRKHLIKFKKILRNTTQGRIPFIFDDFLFCSSRVIGLDMTENMIFTLCHMIT